MNPGACCMCGFDLLKGKVQQVKEGHTLICISCEVSRKVASLKLIFDVFLNARDGKSDLALSCLQNLDKLELREMRVEDYEEWSNEELSESLQESFQENLFYLNRLFFREFGK